MATFTTRVAIVCNIAAFALLILEYLNPRTRLVVSDTETGFTRVHQRTRAVSVPQIFTWTKHKIHVSVTWTLIVAVYTTFLISHRPTLEASEEHFVTFQELRPSSCWVLSDYLGSQFSDRMKENIHYNKFLLVWKTKSAETYFVIFSSISDNFTQQKSRNIWWENWDRNLILTSETDFKRSICFLKFFASYYFCVWE